MLHRDGTVALSPPEIAGEYTMYMKDETRHESQLLRLLNIVFLPEELRETLPVGARQFVDLQRASFRDFERNYTNEREVIYAIYCGMRESGTELENGTARTFPGLYGFDERRATDLRHRLPCS